MSLKSNNVEFVQYCGGHFENGDRKKFVNVGNHFGTSLSTHISNFDDIGQWWIFAVLWQPFLKWRPVEIFQFRESNRDIIIYPRIKFWWYRTMLNFYRPFWKFLQCRIAPLMVTYHYVKFYVSIIIHLEVININVRNFNFPMGFYSKPHPLWTPLNMTLTPFITKLKTENFWDY
jgi:hypothetical protein